MRYAAVAFTCRYGRVLSGARSDGAKSTFAQARIERVGAKVLDVEHARGLGIDGGEDRQRAEPDPAQRRRETRARAADRRLSSL